MNLTIEEGSIYFENGMLVIDASKSSMATRHYNITINEVDGKAIVVCERPKFEISGVFGHTVDPEIVIDADTKYVKQWFFLKRKKVCKDGWVELKQRIPKQYTATNYTIIQ